MILFDVREEFDEDGEKRVKEGMGGRGEDVEFVKGGGKGTRKIDIGLKVFEGFSDMIGGKDEIIALADKANDILCCLEKDLRILGNAIEKIHQERLCVHRCTTRSVLAKVEDDVGVDRVIKQVPIGVKHKAQRVKQHL